MTGVGIGRRHRRLDRCGSEGLGLDDAPAVDWRLRRLDGACRRPWRARLGVPLHRRGCENRGWPMRVAPLAKPAARRKPRSSNSQRAAPTANRNCGRSNGKRRKRPTPTIRPWKKPGSRARNRSAWNPHSSNRNTKRLTRPLSARRNPRRRCARRRATNLRNRRRFSGHFNLPGADLLTQAKPRAAHADGASLQAASKRLSAVLTDFGVQGEIVAARPGPVVTLFEFEPAPGVKSSRVVGLADDIARSMSATAARVAVIPGRNAIGIELPNPKRETVYLRSLLSSAAFIGNQGGLPLALGRNH